jgi:hypothetical protein
MADDSTYQIFKLKNKEFSVDVDVSTLPCGLNGALYFVEMSADGGMGKGNNNAGAKFGTGYCDAQCPHDLKWINGEVASHAHPSHKRARTHAHPRAGAHAHPHARTGTLTHARPRTRARTRTDVQTDGLSMRVGPHAGKHLELD